MTTYNGNALTGNERFGSNDIINFDYVGSARQIELPRGEYLFECWGAEGGHAAGAPTVASKGHM